MPRIELQALAPDFCLPDYTGQEIRLTDFRNRQNVLLVFNRGFL
ncbi:MAG: redoxin domain-containing protein [Anaerolineales bacterium]|nr:redoxin domain-containing protein [Anaerolineales bacterium]TFG50097.1 MAG: redoxin domain-containing protein [Anaerolineales bacterium]